MDETSHPNGSADTTTRTRTGARDDDLPRRPQSWGRVWLIGLIGFGLATLAVLTLPLGDEVASRPDVEKMFVAAIVIAAVTTIALFMIIRLELRLPVSVAVLCVVFNALVVGVKFVAAPDAVYAANAKRTFTADISLNDSLGAWLAAGLVFTLYALALFVIFRWAKNRSGFKIPASARGNRSVLAVVLTVVVILVALAATGIGLLLALLGLEAGANYLGYVFGSAVALVVAVVLALAATAATVAFRQTGDLARSAGDVGVLVSLFWICLAFVALYHVLWVVYILLITSLWPLKVVTPK